MAMDLPTAASPYRVPRSRIDENYETGQPLPFVQVGAAEVISLDGDKETCTVDFGDGDDPISGVVVLCDELDVEVGDWREIHQRGDLLCIPETPTAPGTGTSGPVTIILRPTGAPTLIDGISSRAPISSGSDPAMGDESLTTYVETYSDWNGSGGAQSSAVTTALDTLDIDPADVTEIAFRVVGQIASSPAASPMRATFSLVNASTAWTTTFHAFGNDDANPGYWYFTAAGVEEDDTHIQGTAQYGVWSTSLGAVAAKLADPTVRLAIIRMVGIGQAAPYLNALTVNEVEIHVTYTGTIVDEGGTGGGGGTGPAGPEGPEGPAGAPGVGILLIDSGDPVPGGTPAGTVIIEKAP